MSFVKRVTLIADGQAQVLFEDKKKKKKSSRMMRPMEKITRRVLEAGQEITSQALDRHDRSSRKRKDGWAQDMMKNTMKSGQKGMKKLVKL